MQKCCIIYWGLIRGFKYDFVYETHRDKIYNYLEKNDIEYDIYIVTNDADYDDCNIKKLKNLKKICVLSLEEINQTEIFKTLVNNFNFHSHFTNDSKKFLSYCYFNRKYIMKYIPDTYNFYISLDIQHLIEKFDFLKYLTNSTSVLSNYHKQTGVNPRVFIGDYRNTKIYNSIADYALLGNYSHNPESLLKYYLQVNNINFIETDDILIHRVRACGMILKDN